MACFCRGNSATQPNATHRGITPLLVGYERDNEIDVHATSKSFPRAKRRCKALLPYPSPTTKCLARRGCMGCMSHEHSLVNQKHIAETVHRRAPPPFRGRTLHCASRLGLSGARLNGSVWFVTPWSSHVVIPCWWVGDIKRGVLLAVD